MITAFIIVGCIVAACLVISAIAAVGMSGACRDQYEDDAECAALAEWNAKHRKHSNTAVSASQ